MNIPHQTLDAWRVRIDQIRCAVHPIRMAAAARDAAAHKAALGGVHDLAVSLAYDMEQAGATRPVGAAAAPTGFEVPLALVRTPANLRLLAILRDALDQSQRVDVERDVIEGAAGPTTALLEMVIAQVSGECYGADSGS